ncbi:MAG: hypothetical protein FFODKBPE_00642 [Candidatus Argoarchaeum ethanivorans]|uniref:Uncharacterized protein n=1 Tax=Candidatus Argoarchaeum ethanivorans TaxID=2608793 RepID=A0A811THC0_9EURY|nr:MAG: hypothetical protein FFODKBPE_00642 [Candidatus Argoarchaeum ethanivorans]
MSSKEAYLIFADVKTTTYAAFNATVQEKGEDEVNVTCPHCGSNIRIKLRAVKLSSKAKIQKWFTILGVGSLLLLYFWIDKGFFIVIIFMILIASIVGVSTGFAFFNPISLDRNHYIVGDTSHDLRFPD